MAVTQEEREERNIYKEMIDPDYPLLVSFKELAPGTYRHCSNVLTFCESVSKELNLDIDLMRAAALYHDIGKMNSPSVFSENQNGTNIHDSLEPKTSYHLITRHVGDGLIILSQIKGITIELLNIIAQHHGNTVLKYFYDKDDVDEDKYRYKCHAPTTLESSVIMIADSVEATARSLFNNGKMGDSDDKKKVVEKTVNRLINDNQLDELKVGDLKKIKNVLHKELQTMYHKREDYDETDEENLEDLQ
jgi:cyclic-di-AMP phosphodiesterase PgpH